MEVFFDEVSQERVDNFLAHHGVKGMKWGVRKKVQNKVSDYKKQRSLNKESRAKDREKNNAEIDRARKRISEGKAISDYEEAKAKYKEDKKVIGSREAKKALNKVRDQNYADFEKANELKPGKEKTLYILGVVGIVALSVIAKSGR